MPYDGLPQDKGFYWLIKNNPLFFRYARVISFSAPDSIQVSCRRFLIVGGAFEWKKHRCCDADDEAQNWTETETETKTEKEAETMRKSTFKVNWASRLLGRKWKWKRRISGPFFSVLVFSFQFSVSFQEADGRTTIYKQFCASRQIHFCLFVFLGPLYFFFVFFFVFLWALN